MKKITLLAAVAIAVLSTSCTKDRVCTCTVTPTTGPTTTQTITYFKSHKKNARLFCEGNASQEVDVTSGVTNTGSKTTCTLK